MEKINVEEVYGEPINEEDLIFKLSNSGKKVNMHIDVDTLLTRMFNEQYEDEYEMSVRIANEKHEGRI